MNSSVLASLFTDVSIARKLISESEIVGPGHMCFFILLDIVEFHSKEVVPIYIPVNDV